MKTESERIIKFIKDYVKQSGSKGVVLGLSGGIDSAVVAVLAKKAIGNKLHCVYLPEREKDHDFDLEHIEKLSKRFDITFIIHTIGELVNSTKAGFWEKVSKIPEGNMKARIRMFLLYTYANNNDYLVIGTGNKSELMIGYFTKYGDGGVDFEPLGHLYKTEVFELAKYLNIPNEIVDKPPTAGLWEGQTDEGEIGMSYEELDKILKHFESYDSNCGYDIDDAGKHKGLNTYDMQKVFGMIKLSEHKRISPQMLGRNNV